VKITTISGAPAGDEGAARTKGAAGPRGGLTVLVNAGPWIAVPPPDYGGIENVVATLVTSLREAGHRVVLATVGESTLEADRRVEAFPDAQFPRLAGPYGDVVGIAHAHMEAVLHELRTGPPVDVVHDHVEVVGASMLAALGEACPPTLQTLHWDLTKHPAFYETFDGRGRVWFAAVSESQLARAPQNLRRQTVGVVPLAAPVDDRPPDPPADHLLGLGRLTHLKGFHIAARAARRADQRLVLAGPVAGLPDQAAVEATLAAPDAADRPVPADLRYYLDEVAPLVDGSQVRWVGAVGGPDKDHLLRTARAVVFPLQWDEPGGTAMVEALLAGVPVVGFRRGVLPSLVEDGVNGFVCDDEDELVEALRRVDGLDRAAIAAGARDQLSPARMAADYVRLYEDVMLRAATDAQARTTGRATTAADRGRDVAASMGRVAV
jgi:glycosyltransferase involved in cell wall biosynthesis